MNGDTLDMKLNPPPAPSEVVLLAQLGSSDHPTPPHPTPPKPLFFHVAKPSSLAKAKTKECQQLFPWGVSPRGNHLGLQQYTCFAFSNSAREQAAHNSRQEGP